MTPFLKEIAAHLYERFGNDMSRIAVVFPNKRASIFMNDYFLQGMGNSPLWAPTYFSINDFFDQLCPLRHDDPIRSIFILYNIYRDIARKQEDKLFDINYFYSWGQQLINDFNNIDKNMVDAERILTNASEIWKLEELDKDTAEILRDIFQNKHQNGKTSTGNSVKTEYQDIWNNLYAIYKAFNAKLEERGEAYAGARNKYVVEKLEKGELQLPGQYDHFVFVGFNVLLQSEERLFKYIQKQDKASFYWDCDRYFWEKESQFTFSRTLKKNVGEFGNAIRFEEEKHIDNPKIEFISTSSDNAQAHYASQWLSENLTDEERRTAIILCDENQLQAVLHAIPGENDQGKTVKEINITKGFSLGNTPAYNFVANFLDSQNVKENDHLVSLLEQLGGELRSEAHRTLALYPKNSWEGTLYAESFFQCYTTVNRIKDILNENILDIRGITLQTLLLQTLKTQTIPFKGEPAAGLQIMGMLETRNLDFDQILLLGVNEGNIPKKSTDHSFLPYDLRKAYRLTTDEEESEIYAYNFFRLLQRCKHITYMYNTQGENNCEISRFLQQLRYNTHFDIHHLTLKEQHHNTISPIYGIDKDDVQAFMAQKDHLSPSAIIHYNDCPMKFYFSDIACLQEDVREDLILPANTQGSIFHEASQLCFEHLVINKKKSLYGYPVGQDEIKSLTEDDVKIDTFLTKAFLIVSGNDALSNKVLLEKYIDETKDISVMNKPFRERQSAGRNFIARHPELALYTKDNHTAEFKALKSYLKNTLRFDARWDNLHIVSLETKYDTVVEGIEIGGFVDRLDIVKINDDYTLRVVDYKTGSYNERKVTFQDMSSLFTNKDKHYIFQTFIYCQACMEKGEPFGMRLPVAPLLLFTPMMNSKDYSPYLQKKEGRNEKQEIYRFQDYAREFREILEERIQEMKTSDYHLKTEPECEYCPFCQLCNKKPRM